jgi:hypothetical protein
MDPNETLRQIRMHVAAIQAVRDGADEHGDNTDDEVITLCESGEALAELVDALDEWLSRGGFLPAAWTPRYPLIRHGRTVWACCESSIGPVCKHLAPPA